MESPRICEVSWGLIRVWRFCYVLMSPNLWRRWRTKWSGWVHRQLEIWESSFVTSCTCWNSPVASAATCCHSQVVDGTWTVAWNLSSLSNWVACHHLFPSSCLGWWFHAAYLPMLHALSRSLKPPRLCCRPNVKKIHPPSARLGPPTTGFARCRTVWYRIYMDLRDVNKYDYIWLTFVGELLLMW